ncbi:MAG: rhomboid family intramembrane serine protease [Bacteroidia bacterium]|nr:rhomboid family intramembrane serine protease [Bacteroidia bacterium]
MGLKNDIRNKAIHQVSPLQALLLINAGLFILFELFHVFFWLSKTDNMVLAEIKSWLELALEPKQLIKQPWSIITYAFMHDNFMHILFNMLVLFWFGSIFSDFNRNNHRLWFFYISGALGGAFLALVAYNFIPAVHQAIPIPYLLGASAAVMCIVVATATLVPEYEVMLLLLGSVKIKYLAIAYVLIDFLSMPAGNTGGKISHIGGAVLGYVLMRQIKRGNDPGIRILKIFDSFGPLFGQKGALKVVHRAEQKKRSEGPTQEQVDAILDKISQSGYESLTPNEKEILFKASKNE